MICQVKEKKKKRKKFEAFYLNLSVFPLYLLFTKVAEVNQYSPNIYTEQKFFSLAKLICAFLTFAGSLNNVTAPITRFDDKIDLNTRNTFYHHGPINPS